MTTIYVYNVAGQLIAEYSDANQASSGGTSYLTADHLGSTRIVTDSSGNVKDRHDYLPFGEEIASYVSGRSSVGVQDYKVGDIRQKFTGKERDNETELDYFGARYYSSAQGRFTSVDPLLASANSSNPQSFNRYAYVLNNPLALVDKTGAFPEFTFSVYVRAFAPFEWFGPGRIARGDNRGFSTDPNASYRMQAYTEVTAGDGRSYPMTITRASDAVLSETSLGLVVPNLGLLSATAYSECYINDWYENYQPDGFIDSGNRFLNYHMYGNDDAIPFVSADIDLNVGLSFNYVDQGNGVVDMTVTGLVTGDQFPAAEAFMRDTRGNSVMLGVFAPAASSGPVFSLPGNGTSLMISANVTVRVNNGVFQGVVENGNVIPLEQYNRRFTNQSAVRHNE